MAAGAVAQELKPEDVLGQDREITVPQAVALGLEYNLNLQIQRNDPALARERVREAWGQWEPSLVGGYDREHTETPVASNLQALLGVTGNRTFDNTSTYNAGLVGVLPWGLSYSSGYKTAKLTSSSGITSLRPQYTSFWANQLTLPLLRNFYWGPVDLQVSRSRLQRDISDAQFKSFLTDGVFGVESAYWSLAAARSLERATKESVDTANDLLEQTKVQYQVGVVSKVIVTQAEAALAQRESDHIVALNEVGRAQDRLLTAILSPQIDDYANTTVRTEDPTFVPYDVNAQEALEKARSNRPELLAAEKTVEDADVFRRYAWNQKLPALDVTATYTPNGLSGTQKIPAGTPLGFRDDPNTPVSDPVLSVQPDFGFPTNRFGADDGFFRGNGFHNWGVGATLSVPLGNDTADARYVQRKIELRRAKTNLARTEQDVIVDVRTAVRELRSSIDRVTAAQRARVAQEESLHAEQERLRLGDSTPHQVSQFQDDLLRAESAEISALQTYRTAITALERAQGTLLEARGITVENERERGMDQY
jgi:outer membrane protein TolC